MEGDEASIEYEVDSILDYRTSGGHREYLIRWKHYQSDMDSWEREDSLNCDSLVEKFWRNGVKHPIDASEIKDVYLSNGKYFYLIQTGSSLELLASSQMQRRHPKLMIQYLESLTTVSRGRPTKNTTRKKKNQ